MKNVICKYKLYFICTLAFTYLRVAAQVPGAVIDVKHYTFSLKLNDENNNIKGRATVIIKFLKDTRMFRLNLVKKNSTGKGMLVTTIQEAGSNLHFTQDSDVINIYASAKANSRHNYIITYQGIPTGGFIISANKFGRRTFFGDNWPTLAHSWLPCVDHPADKASVDFIITAPAHYQVIANGIKIQEKLLPNHLKLTHWQETTVLPTKVMVVGAADFAITQSGNVNGIPVYSYVFRDNKDTGFKSYAYAPEILNFYISKIGPYPYKKLANVQSKTTFGGMENASAIFYFENSVEDKGIESLMAHEIAHQWFGDAASEKDWPHVWLSEGFATYLTNCYLEKKYGTDSLKKRLMHDRVKVLAFEKKRFTPIVDSAVKDDLTQLLNANSYEKGSWVLHMLRKKLGDDVFWKGIRKYFKKYNGGNANTNDFKEVMEEVSGTSLQQFFKQWLYTPGHPDLILSWRYDTGKGMINLQIDQKQNELYEFKLEYAIDGQLKTIAIKDKTTTFQVPSKVKPSSIVIDPDVNLLGIVEVNN